MLARIKIAVGRTIVNQALSVAGDAPNGLAAVMG